MKNRIFHIFFILFILAWISADRHFHLGTSSYGLLLLIYLSILFCGSYFIEWGFFFKSVCSVKTKEKCIALSFDDGPTGTNTERILDILQKNGVETAFFCIGKNIPGREEQLKRILREGHVIGNHSYSHHRLFDLFSSRKMLEDIRQMDLTCKDITGLSPRFFRPPYGVTNPNLKRAVLQGGLISIGWSIRSYDTSIRNEERLYKKIMGSLKPGAIVLLHDSSDTTVQILPRLLKAIQEKGYQLVRLDKMINFNPYV